MMKVCSNCARGKLGQIWRKEKANNHELLKKVETLF